MIPYGLTHGAQEQVRLGECVFSLPEPIAKQQKLWPMGVTQIRDNGTFGAVDCKILPCVCARTTTVAHMIPDVVVRRWRIGAHRIHCAVSIKIR
ncbi:MAG: hypothetical protein KC488_09060, partial [Candidatus Cloacimonetes bacterium]|nr:hypothetical protein [Candidatus Cloacimonadota bacterium]